MKSMLHEATSVVKAIEKAWINSGKPLEFKINILEEGEKNFLGMSKHPAIVSITYDPRGKVCSSGKKGAGDNKPLVQPSKERPKMGSAETNRRRQDDRYAQPKREDFQQERAKANEGVKERSTRMQQPMPQVKKTGLDTVGTPKEISKGFEDDGRWTEALIGDAREWIEQLMAVMRISTPFSLLSEDGKALRVSFAGPLGVDEENARVFFASLSYLVIQFLKKKYKKRFPGFHLVISSQEHASGNKPQN